MKKKKGFTLIELLAVIVILGLLMAIAIPSVTKYITQSRKKTLVSTIGNYISALVNEVNDMKYTITSSNVIYAVPIECIALERGGTDPFGEWMQATNNYFAYVLVQYDDASSSYTYGFTFRDSAGYGLYPTVQEKLNESGSQIQTGLIIEKPISGIYTNVTNANNWKTSGFNINSTTQIRVLTATSEGETGDGISTCTLAQKGKNYAEVEAVNTAISQTITSQGKVTSSDSNFLNSDVKRSEIESVHMVNHTNIPSGAKFFDASTGGNGSTMGWTIDSDNDGMEELYIGSEGGIKLGEDSSYLFSYMTNAETIDLSGVDTSNVKDMSSMFYNADSVKNLDLSSFNTSNVRNMSSMFSNCDNLETVNVSSFNTSKVTNMSYMFVSCAKLKTVDLSNFDTSRVTDMKSFFNRCYELQSVNLSGFDTSKVTDMRWMFQYCRNLTKLDLSSFDIRNVTEMEKMFQYDAKLTCIRVGENWQFNANATTTNMYNKAGTSTTTTTVCS